MARARVHMCACISRLFGASSFSSNSFPSRTFRDINRPRQPLILNRIIFTVALPRTRYLPFFLSIKSQSGLINDGGVKFIMSLRWIHENLKAPTCDEECSDIDDSCSDDSYDTDLSLCEKDNSKIEDEKGLNGDTRRQKRETRRPPTTIVTFDENGTPQYETPETPYGLSPYVIWDPRQPAENPIYNSLVIKLYCRTGYHLAITPSGKVRGLTGTNEAHALLRVIPISFGVIRIQGIETQLYLAFNKKGHLYGESNMNKDNTEWEQWSVGSYDAFRSHKYVHSGWWIGIKKNGRAKSGPRTAWGQKAIQFLAITQD